MDGDKAGDKDRGKIIQALESPDKSLHFIQLVVDFKQGGLTILFTFFFFKSEVSQEHEEWIRRKPDEHLGN